MTDNIVWDDAPAPDHDVVWDDDADAQREKARALVHAGQNSFIPNFGTAAGKSFAQTARKLVNLLNINGAGDVHDPDAFGSDENIKRAEEADKPAYVAPGGRFGQVVADTAATIPIGGPVEAGTGALLRTALPKALEFAIPTAKGAASGAVNALATSDPGDRLKSLEAGAGVGAVLGGAQQVGGRVVDGLVKKAPELQNLEGDIARINATPGAPQRKLFVPVSQGADPEDMTSNLIGKFYKNALPYIPGVEGQLSSQAKKAGSTLRGAMLQNAAPEGINVPIQATNDMQLSTKLVKDEYDRIYNNLRNVDNISIPKDFDTKLKTKIMAADPQIPESDVDAHVSAVRDILDHQSENSNDGKINGWNLKNVRDDVQARNAELPMPQRAALTGTTKDYVDDIFSKKLQQAFNLNHPSTQQILTDYRSNAPNYENFRPVNEAVQAAKPNKGDYPFGSVARRANDMTDSQSMDQDAKAILGQKPAQISQAGRIVGYSAIPTAVHLFGPMSSAAILGGGNALATKATQRGLYGDTMLQTLIQRNPKLAASLGYTVRDAITANDGDE